MTVEPKFTEAETQAILEQLDAGIPAHELAKRYGCNPSDIWALWIEQHRSH